MPGEFEFIDNIKSKYALGFVGDDCAVLPNGPDTDLLLTTDLLVEDIDFRLEWTTPELLGHKGLAVSLSDIAAMGGIPMWSMLSIGVAENLWKTDFLERFYSGWHELARQFDVALVGGDLSRTSDKLVIDSIVAGKVTNGNALLRSGARPGDQIFVSGYLGGAAGGLSLLERGFRYRPDTPDNTSPLLQKQLQPTPQLTLGNILQQQGVASALIDLSDGLSSDLSHLCRMSGVGARVYRDRLPVDEDLAHHFPADQCLEMAINGGEDLELLFTVPEKNISALPDSSLTCIGEITSNLGIIELMVGDETRSLEPKGYRHF
jgi:thiamine-monophosphate kinase